MKYISFLLLISLRLSLFAQPDIDEKMTRMSQSESYSWAHKNVFLEAKVSSFSEFMFIPPVDYIFLDNWNTSSPSYHDYTDKGVLFTIAGGALEPRLNIIGRKNYAFHIKFPVTFGLSVTTEGYEYTNLKKTGVFHFSVPILIGYSYGLNSTYSSALRYGFSISGGMQYMRAPISGGTLHDYYADYYQIIEGPKEIVRKNWMIPIVNVDFFKLNKNNKIRGYSVGFSVKKPIYFNIALKYIITKK